MEKVEKFIRGVLGDEVASFRYKAGGRSRKGWRMYIFQNPRRTLRDFVDGPPDCVNVDRLVETNWRAFHKNDVRLFSGPGMFRVGPNEYADSWGEVEFDPADGPPPETDPSEDPPAYAQVFALPRLAVLDIVEFCRVGSHNANTQPADEGFEQAFEFTKRFAEKAGPKETKKILARKEAIRRAWHRMPHGPQPWRMVRLALAEIMEIVPFDIQFADEAGLRATFLKKVSARQAKQIGRKILEVNPEAMELPPEDLSALGLSVPMDRTCRPAIPDYEAAMLQYIVTVGKFRMWWD